jgi:hypothetical protein
LGSEITARPPRKRTVSRCQPPAASDQAPVVEKPDHKLSELTTYELRDYRRGLENAIAFFNRQNPVPPVRASMHARLADVLAEQDDRARIARA